MTPYTTAQQAALANEAILVLVAFILVLAVSLGASWLGLRWIGPDPADAPLPKPHMPKSHKE